MDAARKKFVVFNNKKSRKMRDFYVPNKKGLIVIRVDNFKFLSSLSDVRDGHKDSYNLVHESGIYTVFARHILLNEMSGIINLINLIACKDLVLEKAKVVRAPWLEYAENIVLPSACDVDFSCLNFGDIFAMNAKIIRIWNPGYHGRIYCGKDTKIKSGNGAIIQRLDDLVKARNFYNKFYTR